jgi:hypothetical protein
VPIDNALHLVEERLTAAFVASLPTGVSSAYIKMPNAGFTGGKTPNNQPWARLESPQSFGPISTDASGCYEINDGVFRVSLFWPKGSGSKAAMEAAHEVKELYGQPDYDDVTITSVVVSPTPEPDDSLWFGVRINVNFQYEGFRS